jgi:hypothetical protein
MSKLQYKLYLTTVGFGFLGANYLLLNTRFQVAAIGFALAAAVFFIQALRVK